jgi:hypothetical protein
MNERIKELFKQADFPKFDIENEAEKFAELIVKQCGYYADVFESLGCPVDMDPTDTKPSDYIKLQFGVE